MEDEPPRRSPPLRNAALCCVAGVLLLLLAGLRGGSSGGAPASPALTGVVVAAHRLAAGGRLSSGDLRVEHVAAEGVLPSLLRRPEAAVGRVLAVSLPAGAPLQATMLVEPGLTESSRRSLRLTLPTASVAPDVGAGTEAELVAAVDETPSGAVHRAGEERVVAVVHVVDVAAAIDASPAPNPLPGSPRDHAAGSVVVAIDVDAAAALRTVWAQDYAHALRLLRHPDGAALPAAAQAPW